MPIPYYQTVMLPLLEELGDGREHTLNDLVERLADRFKLTYAEVEHLLPSGNQAVFRNRVGWARAYLKKSGLVDSPRRAILKITQRGRDVLAEKPNFIGVKYLERYPEFVVFRTRRPEKVSVPEAIDGANEDRRADPVEMLESAFERIRSQLEDDLLDQVKATKPAFFERLVVDLLVKMGYGGERRDAAQAVGRSGDGGIDGIIKEDKLGLDVIYLQAKKWEGTIGRPEIQKFAGALQGVKARKGVFITTSTFSREAEEYASRIDNRIVLIDGTHLARLMIDHGLGITAVSSYEVKKLDSDYFAE